VSRIASALDRALSRLNAEAEKQKTATSATTELAA
jgi:hypothetical protein